MVMKCKLQVAEILMSFPPKLCLFREKRLILMSFRTKFYMWLPPTETCI
jgi:hypothetical protein